MLLFVSQATAVIQEFTLFSLGKYISSPKESLANAAATVLLTALKAMVGIDSKQVRHNDEAVVLGKHKMRWDLGESVGSRTFAIFSFLFD